MFERLGLFAPPEAPVLSLSVQSRTKSRRPQGQFEVLVRHLFFRFVHNELLGVDETSRVMQVAYTAALPSLVVALFLYPAYHAFPPNPFPRPFWQQTGDHYFYVMYSFVVMGAATVYEWDLLFPDLLDVFVLSVLPISNRRLFIARILALALFLGMVLFGTGVLGEVFLPMIADRQDAARQMFAHGLAIGMSGTFAAATLLALQGILLNVAGERFFRRLGPFLQGGSLMVLLAVLLLFPALSRSLQGLLASGNPVVFYFPPFWFLGVYERVLGGRSALPVFQTLARTAIGALIFAIVLAVITYPLAYRRRVRQLIEGASPTRTKSRTAGPWQRMLHRWVLRRPAQRATFHFISQTIVRPQRQRVMLAMYGGLGVALALAEMVVFHVTPNHVRPALLPYGIRAAVPIMAFWTVAGLSNVTAAPVDLRGAWLFKVLIGRPRAAHLHGTRLWVTLWAMGVSLATALSLHFLSPKSLRTPLATMTQLLVASGLPMLLADIYLFPVRSVPFTQQRRGSITDLPLTVLRYAVLFPLLITVVVAKEPWIESQPVHLAIACLFVAVVHGLVRLAQTLYLSQFTVDISPDESEEFPQRLGLRDT